MSRSDYLTTGLTFIGVALGYMFGGVWGVFVCLVVGVVFIVFAHSTGQIEIEPLGLNRRTVDDIWRELHTLAEQENNPVPDNLSAVRVEIEGAEANLLWSAVVEKFNFQMVAFLRFSNHDVNTPRRVARIWVEIFKGDKMEARFESPSLRVEYQGIWLGKGQSFMLHPSAHNEEVRIATTFQDRTWIDKPSTPNKYRTNLMIEVLGQPIIVKEILTAVRNV